MKPNQKSEPERCVTGISGLDPILGGGLPKNRLYLLQGEPGTGKTTLALQFLLNGRKLGEKGLYITFSETKDELESVAKSHGWDVDGVSLLELSAIEEQLKPEFQNTVFHPSEVEMNETTKILFETVERERPSRIVFDSVSEMRMLAETPLRYRRQMLALKQYFSGKNCTVLLLDDLTASPTDLQVQSIVHGVINLQKLHPEFGDERRRLNVVKLRGVQFVGGHHDYVIKKGGIQIFPRMISGGYTGLQTISFEQESISSGIAALDILLGGGLDKGTSNLFLGPAGTGKSTLAIQYAVAAAQRGERSAIFAFEESLHTLISRTEALGTNIRKFISEGLIEVEKIDPAQMSPGEFSSRICTAVTERNVTTVVIDSLNGYLHAMPQEQFLILQLHELLSFLGNRGVVTIMVLAQQGMMGHLMTTPVDLTYLADTVLITRFFESRGSVKKAVSVIKKRGGSHETTIREFSLGSHGVVVGSPLNQFQGVLSGVPQLFDGGPKQESPDAKQEF
jgi:circadian clock protein KaiC